MDCDQFSTILSDPSTFKRFVFNHRIFGLAKSQYYFCICSNLRQRYLFKARTNKPLSLNLILDGLCF